jgi:Family of unknown function (DUF6209)
MDYLTYPMSDVRLLQVASLLVPLVLLASCQGQPSSEGPASQTSSALVPSDSADYSCQIVLRHTDINFESSLGPQTDCSSGTCWVVITVTFDVAMSQSLSGAEAFVLYQGEGSAVWEQSPQAEPVFGCDELPDGPCAPIGFRRYQVVLNSDTFTNGPGDNTVQLIPFLAPVGGGRLFDHNRVSDPLGSYTLDVQDNWTVSDDAAACPGPTPTDRMTATFATGWQNGSTGVLAGGGKLDVAYDIYRMPQTLDCTTDGVAAFSTNGYVEFQPSGQTLMEVASGPLDSSTNTYESLPLEFDVPPGTTSASLWFMTSSDCTGAPDWDSNYGQNYVFTAE